MVTTHLRVWDRISYDLAIRKMWLDPLFEVSSIFMLGALTFLISLGRLYASSPDRLGLVWGLFSAVLSAVSLVVAIALTPGSPIHGFAAGTVLALTTFVLLVICLLATAWLGQIKNRNLPSLQ